MASNALATIAAATGAGYKLQRFTRYVQTNPGQVPPTLVNVTELRIIVTGNTGQAGREYCATGEGATSGSADTNALNALNDWRQKRYGYDSASASLSPTPQGATSSTTQGIAPTLVAHTKDKS